MTGRRRRTSARSSGVGPARVALRAPLVFALLLWGGCRQSGDTTNAGPEAVEESAQRGPVKVVVRADRGRVEVAEPFGLELVVDAAAGVEVELPSVADRLESFRVRDVEHSPSIPTDTGRQWRRTYVLESYSPGELEIPALTVSFTDRRDAENLIEGQVSTPALTIAVASLLDGEFEPAQFADIKGAVELPSAPSYAWVWWLLAGVGGVTLLILLLIAWRRRAARPLPEYVMPPHEWALAELVRLRAERLIERGRVHGFYYRLTDIVRQYVERRFGVMAPELTTREFLEEVKVHPALGPAYRGLLGDFLIAGDLVKFALHEPETPEIDAAFDAARGFVKQTAAGAAAPVGEAAA